MKHRLATLCGPGLPAARICIEPTNLSVGPITVNRRKLAIQHGLGVKSREFAWLFQAQPLRVTRMTSKSQSVMNMALVAEGGLLLLALALGLLMPRGPLAQIDWSLPALSHNLGWGVLACLPLLVLLLVLRLAPLNFLRRLNALVDELLLPMFGDMSLAQLALIALLAGVGEEMLFRGVIQAAITGRFGWHIGLSAASVLFGLAHALSRTYAVLAGLVGAYLGGLCLLTGDLLPAIVAHGLYDFCALLFLVRLVKPVE